MTNQLLMVVDDDPEILKLISRVGQPIGFGILPLNTATQFQSIWKENKPSATIVDMAMLGTDEIEFLKWITENKLPAPIILMCGSDKHPNISELLNADYGKNIFRTLTKPFEIEDLEIVLKDVKNHAA